MTMFTERQRPRSQGFTKSSKHVHSFCQKAVVSRYLRKEQTSKIKVTYRKTACLCHLAKRRRRIYLEKNRNKNQKKKEHQIGKKETKKKMEKGENVEEGRRKKKEEEDSTKE